MTYLEGNYTAPALIEELAQELGVQNIDANLINQQKIEAVFNGLNDKTLDEIEKFFNQPAA